MVKRLVMSLKTQSRTSKEKLSQRSPSLNKSSRKAARWVQKTKLQATRSPAPRRPSSPTWTQVQCNSRANSLTVTRTTRTRIAHQKRRKTPRTASLLNTCASTGPGSALSATSETLSFSLMARSTSRSSLMATFSIESHPQLVKTHNLIAIN